MKNELLNDLYEEQIRHFGLAEKNYAGLKEIVYRDIEFPLFRLRLQYNPVRIISTNARIDTAALENRKCFLCADHMPPAQKGIAYGNDYHIFVNPYPIFDRHFTVPSDQHLPQQITDRFGTLLDLAYDFPDYTVFYNGPACGASAPDHFHFQIAPRHRMPLEADLLQEELTEQLVRRDFYTISTLRNYLREVIVLQASDSRLLDRLFRQTLDLIGRSIPFETEPMINLLCWFDNCQWSVCIFPRKTRRPWQFYAEGPDKVMFSPGCVDMAGLIITPRKEDFDKYSPLLLTDLFRQVTVAPDDWKNLKEQLKRL